MNRVPRLEQRLHAALVLFGEAEATLLPQDEETLAALADGTLKGATARVELARLSRNPAAMRRLGLLLEQRPRRATKSPPWTGPRFWFFAASSAAAVVLAVALILTFGRGVPTFEMPAGTALHTPIPPNEGRTRLWDQAVQGTQAIPAGLVLDRAIYVGFYEEARAQSERSPAWRSFASGMMAPPEGEVYREVLGEDETGGIEIGRALFRGYARCAADARATVLDTGLAEALGRIDRDRPADPYPGSRVLAHLLPIIGDPVDPEGCDRVQRAVSFLF
jgi:hypothetical protein